MFTKRISGQYEIYEVGGKAFYIFLGCDEKEKAEQIIKMKQFFNIQ